MQNYTLGSLFTFLDAGRSPALVREWCRFHVQMLYLGK
jgi:hypothetical protein